MEKNKDMSNTERRSPIEHQGTNYDVPLSERPLSKEDQLSAEKNTKRIKEIAKKIQLYKEKILLLTWELQILEKYTNREKIVHIQKNVKQRCENCLQMESEKKEKEGQIIELQEKVDLLQKENKKLAQEANTDKLTDLRNRNAFENDIDKLIEQNENFSVAVLDVDLFKKINDTYWHIVWDQVLKFIATKLKYLWVAYRWWWEEFIIIQKWTEADLVQKIDMIKQSISSHKLRLRNARNNRSISNRFFYVTFSAWVMKFPKDMNKQQFLNTVDSVMYYAKHNLWRNTVIWYSSVKDKLPKPWQTNNGENAVPLELLHTSKNEEV